MGMDVNERGFAGRGGSGGGARLLGGRHVMGIKELDFNIKAHLAQFHGKEIEEALLQDARALRNLIRARTPIGETGNLRKSIVAKILKSNSVRLMPVAFVAIHYRYGPHAHLVEYGHKLVKKIKEGFLTQLFSKKGYTGKLKSIVIGHVPAHPFFRPAVAMFRRMQFTEMAIQKLLNEANKAA